MGCEAGDRIRVTYDHRDGVPLEDELLAALEAAGVDAVEREPPLVAFVRPDGLDRLTWDNPHLEVRTRVWDHPIRVTADRIVVDATE